ncbi:hypothetical protein T03_4445 [Trichinella britovi]|uniref:Uncharacterized protein n=1 Tax=Trichinella britovi TaxID=45882 RepID=A0A0V1D0B2_TRIBR|nr:hypothetical protein T03_4445 [Trichinella britovi]
MSTDPGGPTSPFIPGLPGAPCSPDMPGGPGGPLGQVQSALHSQIPISGCDCRLFLDASCFAKTGKNLSVTFNFFDLGSMPYIKVSGFLAKAKPIACTMCTIRAWMKFIEDNINTLSKANSEFLLRKQWLNFNNGKDYFQTSLISIAGCFAMNDCAHENNEQTENN